MSYMRSTMVGVIDDLLKLRFLLKVFQTSIPIFGKSDGLLMFPWGWLHVSGQELFIVLFISPVADFLSVDHHSSGGVFDPCQSLLLKGLESSMMEHAEL